jgi:outer membrane protein
MNRFIKLAILGVLVVCSSSAFAQQQKFGYVNFQEMVYLMPEIDSIQIKLQQLQQDHSDVLDNMQVELNTKYQEFQKNTATYSATVRQTKERELGELQARIEEFYNNAQQEIALTRDELFAPIVEKARNAVQKIGRENGFFTILDESAGTTLYMDEGNPNMVDISLMVRKELGISPDKKLPEMPMVATPQQ